MWGLRRSSVMWTGSTRETTLSFPWRTGWPPISPREPGRGSVPFSAMMSAILREGGLVPYIRKYGQLKRGDGGTK